MDNIFKWAWTNFFTQLNGFTYSNLIGVIPFAINHLFAHSLMLSRVAMKHQSFVYTQLNDQTVLFQTIKFCMSTKLNSSKYHKQFY